MSSLQTVRGNVFTLLHFQTGLRSVVDGFNTIVFAAIPFNRGTILLGRL